MLGAPDTKDFIQYISAPKEQDLVKLEASYNELLWDVVEQKPKNYKKLLELSFYDVDFNVGENPTFSFQYLTNSYKITFQNLTNALTTASGLLKHFVLGGIGDEVRINNASYLLTKANLEALIGKGWVTT